MTAVEPFRVARPWECPPLCFTRIGTQTDCVVAPSNGVVRQSFIRPRFAPTHGPLQPVASLRFHGHPPRFARYAPTPDLPFVGHAVPRRMNDCLTNPFEGATPQWIRVPVRSTNSGGHSHGRATLKNSMRFPPNTADPIAAFFGYFLCSSVQTGDIADRCTGTWLTLSGN